MILIEFTDKNIASNLIARQLIENHGFSQLDEFRWQNNDIQLINLKTQSVLDVSASVENVDAIIVLSTHKSKIKEKIMTCHYPGNWDGADMKGDKRTLNIAPINLLKKLSLEIKKSADQIGWKFSLEADHHGPTGDTPIVFVEIGSTEEEWNDIAAATGMANAVMNAISSKETYNPVAAFGGGHYPRTFNKIQLESKYAIGHICPKFVLDKIDEEMFRQAIEKNVEKVTKVLIAKDETNLEQKERIRELAIKFGVDVELVN